MNDLSDWRRRFISALANAKRDHGITQEKLAETLGVRQGTISNWKNGTREPALDQFPDIAAALFVSTEWLLFGDVERLNHREKALIDRFRVSDNKGKYTIESVSEIAASTHSTNDDSQGNNGGNKNKAAS